MHSSSAHLPAHRTRLLLKTYFLAVLLLCSGLVMSALGMRKSLSIITPPFFLQPTTQKQVPNHNEITYILTLQVPVLPLRTHHPLREKKVKRCEDPEEEG